MTDPKPPARGGTTKVQLVLAPGERRPVLGTSEPADDEARMRAAAHWGVARGPRAQPEGGIVEPLPRRSRTILSHRLPEQAREVVQGGLQGHEKVPESGVVATVPLRGPQDQ
jgi:hypothetical protein